MAVAAARSCQITVQAEQLPVSSPTDGAWKSYINGQKSWSVSTNQLLTTIRTALLVGSQVELSFCVIGEKGLPFAGFTDNPTLEIGTAPTVFAVVWDKTRKKFLAVMIDFSETPWAYYYYETWEAVDIWPGSAAYTNIDDYQTFFDIDGAQSDLNLVYTWVEGDLYAEKLTGNANVQTFEAVGNIGNLAQGTFSFIGNGALTAASLPSIT